MADKLNKRI